MVRFFSADGAVVFAVQHTLNISENNISKLEWLFGGAKAIASDVVQGTFVGPRKEMVTPWSTNAVEITLNMGIEGISRIELFEKSQDKAPVFDPMLQKVYRQLNGDIFTIHKTPEPVIYIDNIALYNQQEGLALSPDEISYLESVAEKIGRKLTDSEVFGFSQVNSEHCRHKIFNGTFVIDGKEMPDSLFQLIKKTTQTHPNRVVSAYKDNCAFFQGPVIEIFAPKRQDTADFFRVYDSESVISLKAETHNFPTTVEPFNGAATGTGGEIRDRIAGGKASFPLAGTAVYMTSYPRFTNNIKPWEQAIGPRPWLYQTPRQILTKASNGASDFGNKFGQPLICGSLLTFEHQENGKAYGFDKVIMMAGGIGFGKKQDSLKSSPQQGDKVVLLGGDNYRIGMGGGAVSSVATGEFENSIELNAVQRSNPEMQKRAYNAIRAMGEADENPIISIHDHGAGGHLNCLSELVEDTGGTIELDKLPVGDPTLSAKELVGNESQERMGLVMKQKDVQTLKRVADRERAPMYVIGEARNDQQFIFENTNNHEKPIDIKLEYLFGKPPKTIMTDTALNETFKPIEYTTDQIGAYVAKVLQLEGVACKDWLTNKVDRSVTGKIAKQQTAGKLQLPLNNCAVTALDYQGIKGVGTSIGHAPVSALIDPARGSVLSIAEALTNIVWAPIEGGLQGVSLSANWMWPCKNPGEDARLYSAVQAASDFAIELGINIPTGKDSLSMTQKYKDGTKVYAPGTVIISAGCEVYDINRTIGPVIEQTEGSQLLYIDFSSCPMELGGSSFAQTNNRLGKVAPTVASAHYFKKAFAAIQELIGQELILAGHDVSAGGLVTALLEMTFSDNRTGLEIDLSHFEEEDVVKILFSENPSVVVQVATNSKATDILASNGIRYHVLGSPNSSNKTHITFKGMAFTFEKNEYRDLWFKTSYLLDRHQSGEKLAHERFVNYKNLELGFQFPQHFNGHLSSYGIDKKRRAESGIKAAIIREKGVNGDREMANSLYLAGMDVKDVHMTDLIAGRETLEDIHLIVFVGGFSNSDVLGSAKGWAGAFLYNEKAKKALDNFYAREDTLSLGVCNGCQLMVELDLVAPAHQHKPKMLHNSSHKFESSFLNVDIPENHSVMLRSLAGSKLGVWIAHGEGKFSLPYDENQYHVAMRYSHAKYPGNPNGSDYSIAALHSEDGRHLAMMPHLERSIYTWNWGYYPSERKNDEVSPWIEAFVNAREWIKGKVKK
jgi:phosphoribosylformylglycinamidine synthase